jgi:hypothetical protein
LLKSVIILYAVCFVAYILFSRQPDYFDGTIIKAVVSRNAVNERNLPGAFVSFKIADSIYTVKADYFFKKYKTGQKVQVIYDTTNPANAAIYSVWVYWVRWQEIFFSILLIIVAYYGAVAITKNPTAESLAEQMQEKKIKRSKYDLP